MKNKRIISIKEHKSTYFLKIEKQSEDGYNVTREKEFGTISELVEALKKELE